MTVRFACEKDIPQMNSLLYQVERVHQQGRPDLFKEGAKKYTDNELKDMLKEDRKSTRLNSSHTQKSRMPSSA